MMCDDWRSFKANGDYEKGGLLYCGKCHMPKEARIAACNNSIKPIVCGCKDKYDREAAERRKREEEYAHKQMYRRIGFTVDSFKNDRFESSEETAVLKICKQYAEDFDKVIGTYKNGLLLAGNVGCGKSHAAACIANALIDKGKTVKMRTASELLNELSEANEKTTYLTGLAGLDLLIVDDIGVQRSTEYSDELMTDIINSRYDNRKPIVVTTNMTDWTSGIFSERLKSRLKEVCNSYKVNGIDRRIVDKNEQIKFRTTIEGGRA